MSLAREPSRPVTLRELASLYDCDLDGDGETVVNRVATLSGAGADSVTFLANPHFRSQLRGTRAAAVILQEQHREDCPVASLVSANPYATYARVAAFLHPPHDIEPAVHATAAIAGDAIVAESARIGPQVVVGSASIVGEGAVLGAGCVIGANVRIGAGSRLLARVTVLDGVTVGERCVIHAGAVIGSDGFGFAEDEGRWVKVPQLGGVTIGDDVEIGANTTVDRGTIENTVIEDGVKLDNLVQIAHNVRIGAHTVMAAMSGAAGSTKIGRRCKIGGGVVMINHLEICDDVMFTFRSVVTKSVREPGVYGGSLPAEEAQRWRRSAARFRQLDSLNKRVRAIEQAGGDKPGGGTGTRKRDHD